MSHNCNNWIIRGTDRKRIDTKHMHNIYHLGTFLKENPSYLTYNIGKRSPERHQMKVIILKLVGGNVTIFYDEDFINQLISCGIENIFIDGTFNIVPRGLHTKQVVTILAEVFNKV